jgi:hypothetical protein
MPSKRDDEEPDEPELRDLPAADALRALFPPEVAEAVEADAAEDREALEDL